MTHEEFEVLCKKMVSQSDLAKVLILAAVKGWVSAHLQIQPDNPLIQDLATLLEEEYQRWERVKEDKEVRP